MLDQVRLVSPKNKQINNSTNQQLNTETLITRWIQRKGHDRLLLFFNGWGMDGGIAEYLQSNTPADFRYDVLLCYDYRSLLMPQDVLETIASYGERILVAWSLGVWAAQKAGLSGIGRALAINGTLNPISSEEGISPAIFSQTLGNYNEENRTRFIRRMCGSSSLFHRFMAVSPERNALDQKEELASIQQHVEEDTLQQPSSWSYTHALIGGRDMIFSPKAQKFAWRDLEYSISEDMPHFPFFSSTSWPEVCSCMDH